jgi:hypothetical protein
MAAEIKNQSVIVRISQKQPPVSTAGSDSLKQRIFLDKKIRVRAAVFCLQKRSYVNAKVSGGKADLPGIIRFGECFGDYALVMKPCSAEAETLV